MNSPHIGITTASHREHPHFYIAKAYVEAIQYAGGIPHLLPPALQNYGETLERLDGLLLIGGGDIEPCRYNSKGHAAVCFVDKDRDASEITLAQYAMENKIPIFAICRGMQLINVISGGTLHEHLPDALGDEFHHFTAPHESLFHLIKVLPNSALAAIVESLEFTAVSRHHQGINVLASNLQAVAHSPDGLVEAVVMPDHPWLVGVQWHPEVTAATDPIQQKLFKAFIEAARQYYLTK